MRLRPASSSATAEERAERRAEQIVSAVGARVHIEITIPRTDVVAKMRLCTRREISEARAEARQHMESNGFPVDASAFGALGATDEWTYELAVRMLQKAVRDPANVELELAPIDDWRECSDDQIAALGKVYEDLEQQLDPLGDRISLTEAEIAALLNASKKKAVDTLMAYGSRKLALFAITSVGLHAS
jgi:hypothetical protein